MFYLNYITFHTKDIFNKLYRHSLNTIQSKRLSLVQCSSNPISSIFFSFYLMEGIIGAGINYLKFDLISTGEMRNLILDNANVMFSDILFCTILTLQTFLISFMRGIMVAGPLLQFSPTTSAPASSRRRHASGSGIPSWVRLFSREANVITAGTVEIIKNNQVD